MAMAGAASARTAWAANARLMSIRATGETNDDDNDGSCYTGVNAAGTHLIWKNNATELTIAALPALNTDFVWMVACDGTEATPFFGTAGVGWTAGTPVACTSTFGDADGEADINYGNIYQGGQGFSGAIPLGLVWAQSDAALTAPVDDYLDMWVTT